MLNMKLWTITLGCWMAVSFTLCVVVGVIAPGFPVPHRTLELFLPGFTWISLRSFGLGFAETVFYGLYAGWLLVVIHNFFARWWEAPARAATTTKAA